ncbi:MAG: hypothetical protein D3912_10305, partial [Candidatus Electrothrix sp. AX1]|nr:hypothetical protein [Candidatus Electrothrix sp. AX1]
MFFTRKFKKLFSLLALLIWVHLDICTAYAIARSAAQFPSVKITPVTQLSSSPAAQESAKLFDRNTATAYTPSAPALIDVSFDRPQSISAIRIPGPASYILTVQEQINGQWFAVDSLIDIDLSMQEAQWQSYACEPALEAVNALRLQLVPTAVAGNIQGIREIEFWSPGEHEPVRSGMELRALLDQGVAVQQSRQYQAEPASGVIGPEAGEYKDIASDNTFRFDLAYRPAQIKRAYLSYELSGLARWTSAIRSINEQTAMGGYVIERGQGGQQVEEIAPAWLRQGTNQIRFVPVDADSAYTVSKVKVLIELDNGANFVRRISSNIGTTQDAVASLYDGDTGTGLAPVQEQDSMIIGWERQLWQPAVAEETVDTAAVELTFDRLTDLTEVGFYATGKIKSSVKVLLRKQGQWVESAASGNQHIKQAGWQYITVPEGADAQAVRLLFEDASGKGKISELRAVGSNLGAGDEPVINITYPDAGQYFGKKVYVRGFAAPDRGADATRVSVGGQEIPVVNGEFETMADTADADGSLEVTAVYPDGTRAVSLIPLLRDRLEENSEIEVREYRNLIDDEDADDEDSESVDADQAYDRVNLIDDFLLSAGQEQTLHSDTTGAEIKADKGAVRRATRIRMMTLRGRDLPALDAGMVNVTGKAKGFRFLPHGMKFDRKVKVKLPYNKQLIPPGFKDEDVRTYFFDEAAGRWSVLERDSVETATSGVVSETDHFTDMINAVVQVPESPE